MLDTLLATYAPQVRELMAVAFQAGYDAATYGDWNGTGHPALDGLLIEAAAQVETGDETAAPIAADGA